MEVPVCEDCNKHAFTDPGSMMLRVGPILIGSVGVGVALYNIFLNSLRNQTLMYLFLGAGIVLILIGVLLIRAYNQRFRIDEYGHCPEAHIESILMGQLSITTSNRKLVETILAYNSNSVLLVNTTAEPEPMK